MAVEDLLSMPTDRRIVADLFSTYPEGPTWVGNIQNQVFLTSTHAFHREMIGRWSHGNENNIESQRMLSEHGRAEAKGLGVPVIVTGGRLTLDESYAAVCSYFGLDEHCG